MIKTLLPICILTLFLTGCGGMFSSSGDGTRLVHHEDDTDGARHFPATRATNGQKLFVFDPNAHAWAAYNANGERVKTGRGSGGVDFCPDIKEPCHTVAGNFRVFRKGGADCVSKQFPLGKGGAPMPHCMFFHGGYAIHGSYYVPQKHSSHGCIRIFPSAAQWLSQNFISNGTRVQVMAYN